MYEILARLAAIVAVPGTFCMCTNAGVLKSPRSKGGGDLVQVLPDLHDAGRIMDPRWSSIRPPSGNASNRCTDVF